MSKEKLRRERKVNRLLQDESRWLQQVMFGLNKVKAAREKLAETRGKDPQPIPWSEPEDLESIEGVNRALTARVEYLVGMLRERQSKFA